jgi:alpha-beta hydrolase superfamily lysophospholipase
VIVLHGIQSHGGWYGLSCSRLADAGMDVWLPDRRGSGLNQDERGDAPSFRRLLDDIAELMNSLQEPRFLIGISWGGKLAVAFQRRHPGFTQGIVLVTPGMCQKIDLSFSARMTIALARFVSPERVFPIPLNEPELFTANPEFQQFIRDDPLALRQATARLLFESDRMGIYNRWALRHVRGPVLLLLAERDRIIDNAQTRRYVSRFATSDLTIREYARAHHTLEFEPGGPPFLDHLLEWIHAHTDQKLQKKPQE